MTPRFSLVIPTHNRAAFLPETLESVFAQRFTDYEVIVVDDGSVDDTSELLARYGERLRTLAQPQRGPGAARNVGLEHARGEYVVFLDSDDLLMPWSLAVYDEVIREHGAPSVIMSAPERFSLHQPLDVREAPRVAHSYPDYLAAARARYPVSIAAAVRREVLLLAGGFVEHQYCAEDQDLFLRLGEAPGFSFVEAPALYGYRQHPFSKTHEPQAIYQGALWMLERERQGVYPGGRDRYPERSIFLARKNRFTVRQLIAFERPRLAFDIFWRSVPHLVRAGFWRDLYRLPLAMLTRKPVLESATPTVKRLPSES